MLAASDLTKIAEVCRAIGNEVTDDAGFVPVRRLLSRFHADLLCRPLLVEGMLASVPQSASASGNGNWVVLVDSETYDISNKDLVEERVTRPLATRLRNTIAHELVHSLAFRLNEFSINLNVKSDTKQGMQDLVEGLETETERLSPLLLFSDDALKALLRGRKEALSLADLLHVTNNFGISRYVLVNRLCLVRSVSESADFLFSTGLRNLAVGIGVWGDSGAQIRGWPLFWNFDNGIVPSFLRRAEGHERLPAEAVFTDSSFAMLGGPIGSLALEIDAGTRAVPDAKKMKVQIEVEERLRKSGEEFLFVVRRIAST